MKAKEVLNLLGITRETLSRVIKRGDIKVIKCPNGRYLYDKEDVYKYSGRKANQYNVLYARVSTNKQKADLSNQIANLENYCYSNGYVVNKIYQDVASGIDFEKRKEFFEVLDLVIDGQVSKVFITYKDRLSRVGFGLFKHLFDKFGTQIIVINEVGNEKLDSDEIFEEIISLLHCFSMKHYSSRKVKKIKEAISEKDS